MKNTTIRICTLGIACCAGLTFAQEGGRRPSTGEGGGNRLAEFLKKVDTNGDGKITKEEFLAYSKKEAEDRFAKIDTNGDGVIDESEIKAAAEKMREGAGRRGEGQGQGEGGFRRAPGSEGKEPSPPQGERPPGGPEGRRPEGGPPGGPGMGGMLGNPEETFKKLDKNGDGFVDAEEFRAFASEEADSRFKRMDEKGAGKISLEDFKAVVQKMREMMRQGGGMRRPGGEGGQGGQGGGFRRPPSGDADKKPEDAK